MEDANTVEVHPKSWMMPNRKGFLDWTYKTFNPDTYRASPSSLFPHQRFVRDFLQFDSPYRGLLLFHELGTGKTASSIAAAEGFINRGNKVVVMVPASLAANYKAEIMRVASIGSPKTKMWALVDLTVAGVPAMLDLDRKVKFIKQATHIVYPMSMLPKSLPKVALVKHGLAWSSLTDAEKLEALHILNYFIDRKYVFINYNGLSSRSAAMVVLQEAIATPNVFVVIDEAHNFISRVVNGGKIGRTVYNMIMEAQTAKVVLLTGTPIINHPFEVAIMLSLVRGAIISHVYTVLQNGTMPNDDSEVHAALGDLDTYVDDILLDKKDRKIIVTFSSHDIAKEKAVHAVLTKVYKVWKRVGEERSYALPTDKEVFSKLFLDEDDPNNPRVKNIDVFRRRTLGLVSYLKTIGEEYFPRVHPMRVAQVPMSQFQFNKYSKERTKEREIELNNKKKSRVRDNNILGNKGSVYRAFSRMTCNFVFPDEISRPFPGSLRQLMKREIDHTDDDGDEGAKEGKDVEEVDIHKKYENAINNAMHTLSTNSETYLTPGALLEKYSPKMARILEDINQSPKTLLYSQFRTVEGLGVMRLVLQQAGYIEVEVAHKAGAAGESGAAPPAAPGLHIVNETEVMSPKYDNKRFITFNADRDKTTMLLSLFNEDSNFRGKDIRLLLITQSGAEGISLKCVRQVLIMEPFWNTIRLSQVIGRAVRARSHDLLPVIERDVTVTLYTASFTKQMLADNFTIRHQDDSKTTDTHVFDIAKKKDRIVQVFLDELKATSVDCRINAYVNKPVASGMQCFAFPVGSNPRDFAYLPRIQEDLKKYREKPNRNARVAGKAVTRKGKKYVVVDQYPSELFDYNAYKDAGVLIAADA